MPEENAALFDTYADQFRITLTPFGANVSFSVSEPHPAPGRPQSVRDLGTIRMSIEHLKTMIMIMRRQVLKMQEESGVKVEVPREVLQQLQIPYEDWDAFWKY